MPTTTEVTEIHERTLHASRAQVLEVLAAAERAGYLLTKTIRKPEPTTTDPEAAGRTMIPAELFETVIDAINSSGGILGGRTGDSDARAALNALDQAGWLRNPGTKIEHHEIRAGDKVRECYSRAGRAVEATYTANVDQAGFSDREYFLLVRRPAPEIPTEPGIRFKARGTAVNFTADCITLATGEIALLGVKTGQAIYSRTEFPRYFTVTEVIG